MFKILTQLVSRLKVYDETMVFYAVAKGRQTGIFPTWPECEAQIKGFAGAKFKKFNTLEEAQNFVSGVLPALPKENETQAANWYAVAKGHNVGVYCTWAECKAEIENFPNPKYRKFGSRKEAEEFIRDTNTNVTSNSYSLKNEKSHRSDTVPSTPVGLIRELRSVSHSGHSFYSDSQQYVHCYTDGSCESNGRRGARAGIGVWFGPQHRLNVSEPVSGPATNNVAEIQAATQAIKVAKECGINRLQINTDSQFLIKCVTQWMPNWRKNGWVLSTGGPVKNRDQLVELHENMSSSGVNVKWNYVKAHEGIEGNEWADRLAREGASRYDSANTGASSSRGSARYKPY